MSSIAEAIGMCLPGTASPPAIDRRREDDAERAGAAVVNLLRLGITPRQIMTKEAFENAIAVTSALGGSTNAVLHLLALANEARVELDLDDFNRVADRVPHFADMKPGGKFHMSDLDRVGGVPVVLKLLLDAGLLHGDVMTVTGKTMAENLAEIDPPAPDGIVVHPLDARSTRPVASTSSPARSPRTAPWSRWPACRRSSCSSRARPACSTASRSRWRRSWPGRSSPAP